MIRDIAYVALGGAAGCVLRYMVSMGVGAWFQHPFPWATLIVNILGCFFIGVLFGLSTPMGILEARHRLVLMTGFCGGFTTFSTFSLEVLNLAQKAQHALLALYLVGSLGLGLIAVLGGLRLARVLMP